MYNFLDNVYFYKNEQALTAEEKHKNTSFGLKQWTWVQLDGHQLSRSGAGILGRPFTISVSIKC